MDVEQPRHMSADEFRRAGRAAVDWIAQYLEEVEQRPVRATLGPGDLLRALPTAAPEQGEAWEAIWRDFQELIMPGVTHWQHPGFAAFFPANSSGPAIIGELLSAGLGINGFLWECSPAITELEMRVMDWLGALLGLPPAFLFGERGAQAPGGGVIHGTASEAVLTAMVAARRRAGGDPNAPRTDLVAYTSTQAHSSVIKAAMVCGIGRDHVRLIPVDALLALRPEALEAQVARDREAGLAPAFVCATLGTTSTGAFDPVARIAPIAARCGMWLHVDAAYAGAACVCPEHRGMLEGVEHADSFNFNPHKWLLTNFDCSAFWTRDRASLVEALSITPVYLRNRASESGRVLDYRDWQVPLGRRFRALKLWMVMRHYGAAGLRAHIRHHVALAQEFESLVRGDDRFELPTPRCLSLVCFRLKAGDEATAALAQRVNAGGRLWITQTRVPVLTGGGEANVLRMALGATGVQRGHVQAAWDLIEREASAVPALG